MVWLWLTTSNPASNHNHIQLVPLGDTVKDGNATI